MSSKGIHRRDFLSGMGSAAAVPLIGTAMAAAPFQATKVAANKGSAKSVVIPTHEFYGNLDERLDFPAAWDINVMNMKGYGSPVLTAQQMAEGMSKPVGTAPLREIAAGKTTVAITYDDLTRATPIYEMVPWVLQELKAAGIKDENILFMGSFATHRPMTHLEVEKKIGKVTANKYAWVNHSCFYGCKEVGTTSRKTNVQINQTFLGADLKITLSGIKVHYDAGYGGGAKAVLPGLAHIDTVEHNHNVILRQTKTSGPVRIFKNEMRLDLIEAARMAKVDFSVQLMYDQKLRPIQVRSGRHRGRAPFHHPGSRPDVLHSHVQGRRHRGGQCLSAECSSLPCRPLDEPCAEGGRHGRPDHPASADARPDSLPEQPDGQPQRHELLPVHGPARGGAAAPQYRANRLFAVHEPGFEEQLLRWGAVRLHVGRGGEDAAGAAQGPKRQCSRVPVRRNAAPGNRTGRLDFSARRLW